jgi:ABC-type Fe3+-citrate transport system substrate-binding protein
MNNNMKNTTMLLIIAVLILIAGGFVLVNGKKEITANVVSDNAQVIKGEMQRVVLSQEGYGYKEAIAKAGEPIAISADNSVKGCLRSVAFNIEGKKYSKSLRTSEDVLELPALSKGTYSFSCSMGMGYGKLIVQ